MKKILIFTFSILLIASCSSEKTLVSNKLKINWDINYVQSKEFKELLKTNEFIENDNTTYSKLKVKSQQLEEKQLLVSSTQTTPIFSENNLKNNFKKINKSFDSSVLNNQQNSLNTKIKKPNNDEKSWYVFNLIGVSLLLLVTGLDVFLALFSIAFDGFYGASLLFFFSSIILTPLSIKAVKNFNEKYPKKESKSENNQPSKNLLKTAFKTLSLIVGAVILMAVLFNEIVL